MEVISAVSPVKSNQPSPTQLTVSTTTVISMPRVVDSKELLDEFPDVNLGTVDLSVAERPASGPPATPLARVPAQLNS
jgi:hypothetical protein